MPLLSSRSPRLDVRGVFCRDMVRLTVPAACLSVEQYNVLGVDADGHGVAIASFYLNEHNANNVEAGLRLIKAELQAKGVTWSVQRCMMDDSQVRQRGTGMSRYEHSMTFVTCPPSPHPPPCVRLSDRGAGC